MKTLYVQRHAKAVKEGYDHDAIRNLRASGIEDATRMGRYLQHRQFVADGILVSPAERALQTADLVAKHTGEKVVVDPRLYGGGWSSLLTVLKEQAEPMDSLRLIGHNPDLEDLCAVLCGIRPYGLHLVPCGVICIRCACETWSELSEGTGVLEWSIRPNHV